MQEIILISILGEYFKNADHFIIFVLDQLVEERNCRVVDHAQHRILPQNFVLELDYSLDVLRLAPVHVVFAVSLVV